MDSAIKDVEGNCRLVGDGERQIVSVYTDGGVIDKNPSIVGGTWACCYVDQHDVLVGGQSGFVTPKDIGRPFVTNNVTELIAVVAGLSALPDGWAGTLYTDSRVTMHRVELDKNGQPKDPKNLKHPKANIPGYLINKLQLNQLRLGHYKVALVKGHASMNDVLDSYNNQRTISPSHSRHNSWCDKACRREAELFLQRREKQLDDSMKGG